MDEQTRIAFVGAGNMAGALIAGLLQANTCHPERIVATDVRAKQRKCRLPLTQVGFCCP